MSALNKLMRNYFICSVPPRGRSQQVLPYFICSVPPRGRSQQVLPYFRFLLVLMTAVVLQGCAIVHRVSIGEIDNRGPATLQPFEIKVSETGVDLGEAVRVQRALFPSSKTANDAGKAAEILQLFQMGPRTGAPVYDGKYAEKIIYAVQEQCPSGRVTGLMSIRETRKYPVISGEIVKIKGYCQVPRKPSSEDPQGDFAETTNETVGAE